MVLSRGSSTALDALLFVLLVGAAIAVLGTATPRDPPTGRVAEETADVLATSTGTVRFDRAGTVSISTEAAQGVSTRRRAHGTYASLLAAATLASPDLLGEAVTGTGNSLSAAVREATRRQLPTPERNVQVRAVWRPYPGSVLRSELVIGDAPPRDASVSAASITAPSGVPNVTDEALDRADATGYRGVAAVLARAVVRGLFPPSETADAFRSEGIDRAIVTHRYRRAGATLGADVEGAIESGDVEAANAALAEALARVLEDDLEGRFETSRAAARALSPGRVRIVVRTWSP